MRVAAIATALAFCGPSLVPPSSLRLMTLRRASVPSIVMQQPVESQKKRKPSAAAAAAAAAQPPPPEAAVASPDSDWGGLPAAISASKAAALNTQILKCEDAEAILTLTEKNAKQLRSVNAATALHRIASYLKKTRPQRDRVLRDQRFIALVDIAADCMEYSNPRSVSDMMWAFATLQHWPPTMLKPLLTRMAAHLEAGAFEAQHLSLITWSFAILELKPTKLLERIEECSISQLKDLSQQNCANLLWGFAKLNYKPEKLLPKITSKMSDAPFLSRMKPVEISDAAFAIAVIGSKDGQGGLMDQLAARATPDDLMHSFSSRQLVTLTWAFARMATRPAQLDLWVARIREEHERVPMLAQDQKNIKAALGRFEVDVEWLNPPTPEEDEVASSAA